MKDHILPDGRIIEWTFNSDLPALSPGHLVERIADKLPNIADNEIAEPGEVRYDADADVTRQAWVVRPKTADELRYVIPPEVFIMQRLSRDDRQVIRQLARDNPDIADLWEKLQRLQEGIISDDPLTAVARAVCEQVFGPSRTTELFAPYNPIQ